MIEISEITELLIDQLRGNPWQPRINIDQDDLTDLVSSIKAQGVTTPITVRRNADGYEIADGHMRTAASKRAGAKIIPAIVRPLTDRQMKILAIAANTFVRLRDSDKETAVYKLWESEFKTEEPSAKGGRRDVEHTGLRQMERETGMDEKMIRNYLNSYETRHKMSREASREVKDAVKELSTKDMAALAPVAKESTKIAQEIAMARANRKIRSSDLRGVVKNLIRQSKGADWLDSKELEPVEEKRGGPSGESGS